MENAKVVELVAAKEMLEAKVKEGSPWLAVIIRRTIVLLKKPFDSVFINTSPFFWVLF